MLLPVRDEKRLKLWLAALRTDPDTSVGELRVANIWTGTIAYTRPDQSHPNTTTAVPTVLRPDVGAERQDTWAVMDRAPGQLTSTGVQVNVPETCTATMEKPPLQHIVDEEAILQLMKNCPMCNRKCRCSKRTRGPYIIVYQSCYFCHYQRKWASQPEASNMNTYKAHTPPKRKLLQKDKVSTKAQSSQLNKTSIYESRDPLDSSVSTLS